MTSAAQASWGARAAAFNRPRWLRPLAVLWRRWSARHIIRLARAWRTATSGATDPPAGSLWPYLGPDALDAEDDDTSAAAEEEEEEEEAAADLGPSSAGDN